MATTTREPNQPKKKLPLFPLISLLSFTSIFFLLSQFRNTSSSSSSIKAFSSIHNFQIDHRRGSCDYSDGIWIYDESRVSRYDSSCKEIFKGWNCVRGNKANGVEVAKWRWKPNGCSDLDQFDPLRFLQTHTHTSIVMQVLLGIHSIGTCLCHFSALLGVVSLMDRLRSGDLLVLTVDSRF
ncbi:variant 3, Protein trichome birefringence-like 13 [Lathyrus oleraceus]|uniref:Variant 3, Protein trichome birefringence-like 13 n=1 Tax=Pisum sativum TaxID=3888 RepID=A0A9D5BFI1_PEA|nr:variant 3, Protein trichome birefringence-like 13 [Pisum sativum]